jgi:hypothetical protein
MSYLHVFLWTMESRRRNVKPDHTYFLFYGQIIFYGQIEMKRSCQGRQNQCMIQRQKRIHVCECTCREGGRNEE